MRQSAENTGYEQPALGDEAEGKAPSDPGQGTEPPAATRATERPAETGFLMEVVAGRENMEKALERVMANRGSPGVDGMRVTELPGHLEENWDEIRGQLLSGTYQPSPVRRVEIPKPGRRHEAAGNTNGHRPPRPAGHRTGANPHLRDRILARELRLPNGEERAPGNSPGAGYIEEGYGWVVDMDIEKFFDNVNHDKLMARVARKAADKRCLKIMRAFLNSGVMEGGLTSPTEIGTPQGGPLSPLLSNIYLDDLDRELERRGHRFVRYADDCNVYVKSERADKRVMESLTRFLEKRLKLKVSMAKSAVTRPFRTSFLGFSFTSGKNPKRRIAPKAIERLKKRVRELTRRTRGISLEQMVTELNRYLRAWRGYFGFCQTPSVLRDLDSWIRRRLRSFRRRAAPTVHGE